MRRPPPPTQQSQPRLLQPPTKARPRRPHAPSSSAPTVPLRDGARFDGLLLTLIKVTPAEPASADAPAVTDAEGGTDAPPPEPTAETQTIVGAVRVRLTPLLEPSMNARRAADGVLHERAVLEISPEFVEAERAGLAAAADAAAADDSAANAPLPPTEVALSISLNADDAVERSLAGEAVDHARLNLEAGVGIAELSVPLSASAAAGRFGVCLAEVQGRGEVVITVSRRAVPVCSKR